MLFVIVQLLTKSRFTEEKLLFVIVKFCKRVMSIPYSLFVHELFEIVQAIEFRSLIQLSILGEHVLFISLQLFEEYMPIPLSLSMHVLFPRMQL